ncbi:retrovirus-related pol polyprotein from transposon TNT 1-94, partial [Tanacetum coccineum]
MTGNMKLLTNFAQKFLGTVKFRNDQIAPILGYGDLVQGDITIKKGYDLLTSSRGTDLYFITLQDSTNPNPICLMAKETSSQSWLWHHRLSHLKFDTINLLSKNNIVNGLPKLKFIKDHLCSSCEPGKAKRKSFHTKTTPSSKRRLQLLHMDLCGLIRVESGRTGGRTDKGGGRTREPRGRGDGKTGEPNDQGVEANEGVDGVPDFSVIFAQQLQNLLPIILAKGNVRNVIVNNGQRGCSYKEFLACNPKEYDGKGGVIVYTRWFKKMESVQDMSGCGDDQKVKCTAGSFVCKALTRADHAAYTDRFHELARLVPHLVTPKNRRIERNGSLKKNPEKRENGGEPSRDRNVKDDNKRTRTGNAFAITANR